MGSMEVPGERAAEGGGPYTVPYQETDRRGGPPGPPGFRDLQHCQKT